MIRQALVVLGIVAFVLAVLVLVFEHTISVLLWGLVLVAFGGAYLLGRPGPPSGGA